MSMVPPARSMRVGAEAVVGSEGEAASCTDKL